MKAENIAMELFAVIKGNAMNKGRARTWIESPKLRDYGFLRGERVTITMAVDRIVIRLDPNGPRKVCGKLDRPLFDICQSVESKAELFGIDCPKLAVFIRHGEIHVVKPMLGAV